MRGRAVTPPMLSLTVTQNVRTAIWTIVNESLKYGLINTKISLVFFAGFWS